MLVVLTAVAVFVAMLRRSQIGSQLLALRANERSAAAAGVSVVGVKIFAFAIAAFIAGLGGALLAYQQRTVTYDSFSAIVGLALFGTVYLAGVTSVAGGLLAGITAAGGLLLHLHRRDVVGQRLVHGRLERPADHHGDPEPGGHRRSRPRG